MNADGDALSGSDFKDKATKGKAAAASELEKGYESDDDDESDDNKASDTDWERREREESPEL